MVNPRAIMVSPVGQKDTGKSSVKQRDKVTDLSFYSGLEPCKRCYEDIIFGWAKMLLFLNTVELFYFEKEA